MIQLAALIDGKPVATTAEVPVEDPSPGEVMAVTADCGPAEIDAAVRSAADAAQSWRRVAVPERARLLPRLSAPNERGAERLGRRGEPGQPGEPADRQAAAPGAARRRDHRPLLRLLRQRGRDVLRGRVRAGR